MKSLHLLHLNTLTIPIVAQMSFCPGPPYQGCTNAMFMEESCSCVCIPPFCPDSMGDCMIPNGSCSSQQLNPNCTTGVDCPWWVNTLKAESCITGHAVPAGLWKIYGSNADCCAVNFPFSEVCDVPIHTSPPTKYPTIAVPEESAFETVPIQFSVDGLPDDVSMRELKDEMKSALIMILGLLAKTIPDLKLSSIEEKTGRRLGLVRESSARALLRNAVVVFNVNVIQVDGQQFGPQIIQGIKDSMSDIQNMLETTNGKYLQRGVNVNFCTLKSGKYSLCTSTPAPVKIPSQATVQDEPEQERGCILGLTCQRNAATINCVRQLCSSFALLSCPIFLEYSWILS